MKNVICRVNCTTHLFIKKKKYIEHYEISYNMMEK